MSRLPTVGGDSDTWGDILNDFLSVAHNADGTLKSTSIASKADDSTVVHNTGAETVAGVKTFSSSPVVPTPTTSTQAANKSYVDGVVGSGAPDATTTSKGIVQLAGDLGGTAASPTVPGLANKVGSVTATDATITVGGTATAPTIGVGSIPESKVTNLTTDLAAKATDANVVHTSGAETIAGVKTFSSAPVVPSGSFPESAVTNLTTDLAATEKTANKGAASGYAPLDGSSKVPIANIPTGTTNTTVTIGNDARVTGAIQSSTVTTKGDLLAASAASTIARLGVGSDGQVLTADSTQATGVKWGAPGTATTGMNVKNAVLDGGLDNTGATNVGAAITAWLATLPDGTTAYFPAGIYKCADSGFAFPSGKRLAILGEGWGNPFNNQENGTCFYFPTDLAATPLASYAITMQKFCEMTNLQVRGNNTGPPVGTAAMNMGGIELVDGAYLNNVRSWAGFYSGVTIVGNHAHCWNVKAGSGCYYGMYYPASRPSSGDNAFYECDLSGCSFASVGVAGGSNGDGDVWVNSHFGFSPYGIYLESGSTSWSFNTLLSTPPEACGNACLFSASSGGTVKGNSFGPVAGWTIDATYRTAAGLARGFIDVGTFAMNDLNLSDILAYPQFSAGTACYIYAGTTAYGNTITAANLFFFSNTTAIGAPWNNWGGDGGGVNIFRDLGQAGFEARSWSVLGGSGYAAGQPLELTGDGNYATQATSGSTKPLVGIILDGGAGGVFFAVQKGVTSAVADGVINSGDVVTPDGVTTANRLKTKTNSTDRIIGYATNSTTAAGQTVFVHVQPQLN